MKETVRKLFTRTSAYHELITDRNTSYYNLVVQASLKFDELMDDDGKELALFKVNGAVAILIGSGKIRCGGELRPWTLGNYLQFVAKRAPSQLKIGVGYVISTNQSSQSSVCCVLLAVFTAVFRILYCVHYSR